MTMVKGTSNVTTTATVNDNDNVEKSAVTVNDDDDVEVDDSDAVVWPRKRAHLRRTRPCNPFLTHSGTVPLDSQSQLAKKRRRPEASGAMEMFVRSQPVSQRHPVNH